jgi:hypothetical protein
MLRTRTLLPTLVLLGGFGLPLLSTPAARAGLIPNKVTVMAEGDAHRWTYNVVITSDVYIRPGDYFTIYDFAGAIPGAISVPDEAWSVTEQAVGITPDKTNPLDDPAMPNYTMTWTGEETLFGQLGLGNFSFLTPYSNSVESDFTSATHRQDNDQGENNITSTTVPVASATNPPSVPEPATLVIAAAGLPLGLLKLRRRRQK